MTYCRDYKIEMDYLRHTCPKRLYGGRIDVVGNENKEALLTIPVQSLSEIEPFKYYDIVVRRHFPEWAKGLPLKIKALGHIALEPYNYIGAGEKNSYTNMVDGMDGFDGDIDGGNTEIIHEEVPAEVFEATMFGFGNAAMLDDIIIYDNSPYPFVRVYVNDEGKWVIMPCQESHFCRPKRLIVRRVEVIREPFKAHTLAVKKSATPYVHPQHYQHTDFWTQGNFGCGCGDSYNYGRGIYGRDGFDGGYRW